MNKEKQTEEMIQYYVLRNKDTGMYFRGKGVNRWGKYFNQATIYRVKGNAEASAREVSWHGEKVEIVSIQIFENHTDYRKAYDVARKFFNKIKELLRTKDFTVRSQDFKFGYMNAIQDILAELKKKYESEDEEP